ncbi:MAG: restriction endonuclease [Planctomycetes bacterium]|nr:restriction endonuclease [Planctomycetota bacterium]
MLRSDLPFGSEFSPSQIELAQVLEFAAAHPDDWRALEDEIRTRYFESHDTTDYNRRKLANNCKLGMIAYGMIERSGRLTQFGEELASLRSDPPRMYERLARHILLNLGGLIVIQAAQDMEARGQRFSLQALRQCLEERGVHFPRGGKHPSTMRLWLEKAGVVVSGDWKVDRAKVFSLVGASPETLDQLSALPVDQKAFLKTLANLSGPGPYPSNEVERLAATSYGATFNEKALPKTVLYPLRDLGYIVLQRGTGTPGRGAKPFLVSLTAKMQRELVAPLLQCLERQTRPDIRPLLRKPLSEILGELSSGNRHIRGLALEALAFYLMRLVDLKYVATRLRGDATGGAEVDLVFEGARLMFSRWQIQCKNTNTVSLDDVAKEVGLTLKLKSSVVMVVSTGRVGQEARRYAQEVMRSTNLHVVLLDGDHLRLVAGSPWKIADILNEQAQRAMEIKRIEVEV